MFVITMFFIINIITFLMLVFELTYITVKLRNYIINNEYFNGIVINENKISVTTISIITLNIVTVMLYIKSLSVEANMIGFITGFVALISFIILTAIYLAGFEMLRRIRKEQLLENAFNLLALRKHITPDEKLNLDEDDKIFITKYIKERF